MKYTLIKPVNQSYSPVTQVLTNRGIDIAQIDDFLSPSIYHTHSLNSLVNLELAAKCILKHILHEDKIYIQVDSDCDGYTSAAVLINYLYRHFPSRVVNCITYGLHENKHHGIGDIPDDVKLVIAPDSSSNENEMHKGLYENGIDVVVLDHHHADWDLDDPAIIVNNQMCQYPNKALSGVGIVYKLCREFDSLLGTDTADEFLDLVALGLTADMMDTRELETRYYILEGFKQVRNPFFRKLAEKNNFSMKGIVNQHTVAWYIAPYINAMTRTGTLEEKELLFKSMLQHKAFTMIPSTKRGCKGQEEMLIDQAIRVCASVKNRQETAKKELLEFVNAHYKDTSAPVALIPLPAGRFETGLSGLVANQLMSEYKKPVFVLHYDQENGTYEGSGRGFATDKVHDWREFCAENGAEYAEGHAMAFGVKFTEEGATQFLANVKKLWGGEPVDKNYDVDFIWNYKDQFDTAILELAGVKGDPWGQGVPEPMVVVEKVPVSRDNIRLMGKGTIRIDIPGHLTNCIKFGGEAIYDMITAYLTDADTVVEVNICGVCALNEWNGRVTPQIQIKDCEIASLPKWNF